MRRLAWLGMGLGAVLLAIAGMETTTENAVLLVAGVGLLVAGCWVLLPPDVLGDHPDEIDNEGE